MPKRPIGARERYAAEIKAEGPELSKEDLTKKVKDGWTALLKEQKQTFLDAYQADMNA